MPSILPSTREATPPPAPPGDAAAPPEPPRLRPVPARPLDFDAAVRALTPRLQRYATRRLGDRHEAEELVQEALLRAYQHRDALATEDDVAAWTTCVTGRLVVDRLRVRGRSTPVAELPEGARTARDTADVVVAREQARTALDALDAMPPRQAAVLWAREVEGLSYDAIGSRFGLTEPAVRSLLSRARSSLRAEYAVRGGTLPGVGLAVLAPWAAGTGWLARLRGTLARTAPTALGAVTVGVVLAGVAALPSPASPAAPAVQRVGVTPAAVVSATSAPAVAAAAPPPASAAAAPEAAARPPAPASTPPPAGRRGVLGATGLNRTCAAAGRAGAGGAACAPQGSASTVQVGVGLRGVPVLTVPEVATNSVDCAQLPPTPVTSCTPSRKDP